MANEKRLIDANALMDALKKRTSTAYHNELWGLMLAQDFVEDAPTVDAVEVVHGRWEEYQVPHIMCCSECDWATGVQDDFNYCPNCGAKMDGDGNE